MEPLMDVKDASALTGLKPKTLYAYAERKIIPHVKLGSRLLFSREKLEVWIEGNSIDGIQRGSFKK